MVRTLQQPAVSDKNISEKGDTTDSNRLLPQIKTTAPRSSVQCYAKKFENRIKKQ